MGIYHTRRRCRRLFGKDERVRIAHNTSLGAMKPPMEEADRFGRRCSPTAFAIVRGIQH
jgi:hypothetical protein